MSRVTVTKTIPQRAERVWSVLAECERIVEFHPLVETSECSPAGPPGVGTHRVCRLYGGGVLDERITAWNEGEGYSARLELGGSSLRDIHAEVRVRQDGEHDAAVTLDLTYTLGRGPLSWLRDRLIMRRRVREALDAIITGLNHHIATGEHIGPGGSPSGILPGGPRAAEARAGG